MADNIETTYDNKYKSFLRFFCNNATGEKMCNTLSYDKSYYCESCKNKEINNNENYFENFMKKRLLYIDDTKNLLNECAITIEKQNKIAVIIQLYTLLYYNFYVAIRHPKYLTVNIKKIFEILNEHKKEFISYIDSDKSYEYVLLFMMEIYDYIKDNDINLDDIHISPEKCDIFLKNFVQHFEKYYENIVIEQKK